MRTKTLWTALTSLLFLLSGCAVLSGTHNFKDLELGMSKGQALELMGSPNFSTRKNSVDYWHYYLNSADLRGKRVLHFDEGQLIYKGHPVPPPISAEEADLLKENPKLKAGYPTKKRKNRYSEEELRLLLKKEVMEKDPNFIPAEK